MSKIFNEITYLDEFEKDKKKLSKRFKTLHDDIEIFINVQLKLYHKLQIDNNSILKIENLGVQYPKIYKVKKFACKSLKGKGVQSGIRIIYAYYPDLDKIDLIEMYYKGDKENEDRDRILKNYKPLK